MSFAVAVSTTISTTTVAGPATTVWTAERGRHRVYTEC